MSSGWNFFNHFPSLVTIKMAKKMLVASINKAKILEFDTIQDLYKEDEDL